MFEPFMNDLHHLAASLPALGDLLLNSKCETHRIYVSLCLRTHNASPI